MIYFKVLQRYLFKLYCSCFFLILLLIIGVLILSNIFDALYKFKHIHLPHSIFWKIISYKIPYLLSLIAPLISFIAMLFFLRALVKRNELIVMLSSGINIWRILIVPVLATFLLSIGFVLLVNPIGALGLQEYELLEAQLVNKTVEGSGVSKSGILLFEHDDEYDKIIQIQSVELAKSKLNNVVILFVNRDLVYKKRIDASFAILEENTLKLRDVKIFTENNTVKYQNFALHTDLSINNLTERFIAPEVIPVWKLPTLMSQLKMSGLPIIKYQVYYYKQLFQPIAMIGMVILASCFISLSRRDNSQEKMLVAGIFLGFVTYALGEILLKTLAYNNISPILSVLLPLMLLLFTSVAIVLHFQKT